jgi:prophage antirepressor-like protein
MNALSLVKSATFGNVQCDFYSDDKEIWMTRKQIGEALEYADPQKAIDNLHSKHKERLDKYSVTLKLRGTDGKMYDTTLYSAKGIYEICRWSKQPKADAFFDWVYDVLEGLRKGQYQLTPVEPPKASEKHLEIEARLRNSKVRQARLMVSVADRFKDYLSKESIQSLLSEATAVLSGRPMLPKPNIPKTYTASEIAQIAGVSANKIGRIANKHNLKQSEYGLWVLDKSPHSDKQVSSFVYNEAGKKKLLELLQQDN